ncbi:hypothetical protein GPROT1_00519 [Gammaproteobacteria bacterium]|nr:hypothetical protein GPROT1_00519 [Gammaproteobacteria bacterium]
MSMVDGVSTLVAKSGWPHVQGARGPLVVTYHGIGGDDGIAAAAFEAQLDLLTGRRRVVSLAQAVDALGSRESTRLAAITFDDGYRDFVDLALPRLRERRLHATLFVPAEHVGGYNQWDDGRARRRAILDAPELCALDPSEVEVGAHGATHVRMRGLSRQSLERETRGAREKLEALCGRPVRLFAYPYGQLDDFDRAAEAAVEEAGFIAACSTAFGRGSRSGDRFRLRRVGIEPRDSLGRVARKLDGAYDWVIWKERGGAALRSMRSRG